MPLVTTAELVGDAGSRGRGIAAFNVITLEHAEGIVAGAQRSGRPVILQVSENTVKFHAGQMRPLAAALTALASEAAVPVGLHLDHAETAALWHEAAMAGYSSVMVDCGSLPYEQNAATTADVTELLHAQGLAVEAELGHVGGKDTQVASAHEPGVRTDPVQAAAFVAATGVDCAGGCCRQFARHDHANRRTRPRTRCRAARRGAGTAGAARLLGRAR